MAIWMGRSVNNLLPVATIGGEILKARIITLKGCHVTDASASVLVDKTVQVLAVIIWGLIGVGLLLYSSVDDDLAMIALAGFAVLGMGVGGFLFVQRAGMFTLLAKLGSIFSKPDSWEGIHQSAKEVDKVVLEIYRNKGKFTAAIAYKSLGLVLQTSEVWLGCYLLGHTISLAEAMMLKSLTSTLSDVAFIIPNAYGIQEGAYIVVGSLIGLGPDLALAVSLATRIRDVVIDVPGLLFWQRIEAKDYTRRQST